MTIEARFRTLSKLAAECQRHIDRLGKVDSITLQQEVAALIRDDIRRLEVDVQAIKQLADEADRELSKLQILNRLSEYETQLQSLRVLSRQTILRSKQRVDQQEKKNREELFGLATHADGKSFTEQYELRQRGSGGGNEAILRASSDVTEALRRTSTLMQQELEKSTYSATMLDAGGHVYGVSEFWIVDDHLKEADNSTGIIRLAGQISIVIGCDAILRGGALYCEKEDMGCRDFLGVLAYRKSGCEVGT
ncbi:hypothetical protein DFQ28_006240 [Apophysomyces sp. BC1034]|nr:hypothetical protein DFQ30_006315 [Apophysomyces sp. BC1015]KAG0177008.1 hypothetical protein DFQ29_005350 [Apophysomyces sp. BC1021]KAG0187526.1 hypothetical protein DFQ28_006240 [Apophysomyces sp. BC1034]